MGKVSARGPPKKLKSHLKPLPPTPTAATVSSVKLFGDSPGPRGPLNPNLSMVTTDTDSTILMLCAIWLVVLLPPLDSPLLTSKGLPKVSVERGPLRLNLTTVTCTNKPGLPSVLPDSLPPPMELVPMDTTGVEYQLQLLKN